MAHYKPYDKDNRAQRRIQGEDVFGNKIQATLKNHSGRKIVKTSDGPSLFHQQPSSLVAPPPGFSDHDSLWYLYQQDSKQDATKDNNNSKFRPIRRTAAMNTNVSPMEVCYEQQNWQMVGQQKRRQDDGAGATACALPSNPRGRFGDFCDEAKLLCVPTDTATSKSPSQPVDLIVTNLDTTMDTKELRRQLTNMLKEYAMILSLNITVQSDGVPIAIIRVNSQQEAQYTIFHLHRRRLGNKRIVISYAQNDSRDPSQLKAMVIGLLQEVPDKCLPLFKFIELFESRYHFLVSVAEVKKLKDIVKITDDLGPRIISLTHDVKSSPTPNLSNTLVPYCSIHSSNMQSRGWCETSNIQTPNIMMSLKLFANKLNGLLYVHSGCMHLLSFQICYEHKYNEPLPVHDSGVPLEHLISCVPNIEIKYVGPNKNIKVIVHEAMPTECNEESVLKTVPVSLAPNVNLLCRELVDLLKTTDRCQLLVNKFIPAYHHHFGRQCRVADYGYIRLLDLFESIPHVAQIMGDGTRRVITLTHAAQMRRFTSDLLRVLKVQSLKQISITDFPSAFEKVMNKAFNAVEYGLCMFEDLLEEVPENTVVVSRNEEGMMMISVPKRDQTAEEIMRTKQFAAEVIDLLKHSPYFKILFNKFVPAYHHHFGHQCKVSDYGFTKLIELFEAIPDVVEIEELSDGERVITLTLEQSLKVLGQQVIQAIKSSKMSSLQLETLPAVYLREMGYPLKPSVYQCESVAELVEKLSDYIEVIHSNAGTLLVVIDMDTLPTLIIRGWALLLKPPHYKDLSIFKYEYQAKYNSSFSNNNIQQLDNVFTITSRNEIKYIALTALYILAAQLYHMIYKSGGSVLFDNIEKLYFKHYGKPLKLSNYKIFTIDEFYNQFNALFFVRGKKRSVIVLKRNLSEHFVPLPPSIYNNSSTQCSWGAQSEPAGDWQPLPNSVVVAPPTFVKNSPPKPDTPPTSGTAPWNHWLTPYVFDDVCSLSIEMPIVQNPKLLDDAYNLISPAKNIWGYIPAINAPDPAELPMPDKLISKGIMSDDSTDSGVNTKLESSDHDVDLSSGCEQSGAGGSSQKPHFVTFLNFNN